MLQKLSTVPALGAVFLLSTAWLVVQKPELGVNNLSSTKAIASIAADPTSSELFEAKPQVVEAKPMKLASAVARIEGKTKSSPKNTPIPTPKPVQLASENAHLPVVKAPAGVEGLIRTYAEKFGADPEMMIRIAQCESGFRPDAVNGPFGGMYQFLATTWKSNRKAMGLSDDPSLRFDAGEAIKTAAFKMGRDGYGAWPVCSVKAQAQLALN